MLVRHRNRGPTRLALAVGIGLSSLAAAGTLPQFTLQRSNSIDLTPFFFGGGTSQFGVNPISVAFDNGTAWVGGYNNQGTFGSVGVVRIGDVLTASPAAAGLTGAGATFSSSSFRGFQQMAALNGQVYLAYDNNESITPFIRRIDGTTGDQVWQVDGPAFGARPIAMAIDPRGGATDDPTPVPGVPGLRFMSQDPFVSGGATFSLRLSDGAVVYGPGSILGQGGAGVFITAGQSASATFSNRDIAFDENGNFLISTGQTHGVATRAGDNSFVQFNVPTPGAGSTGVLRKQEGVVNGEGINGVFLPAIGGSGTADFMATNMRVPTGTDLSYVQQDGTAQPGLDARDVHLRNLDGSLRPGTTSTLTGAEDFFNAAYAGQVKDLAVGRDANGNPVLLVLSFTDRRLDVYQLEPTFTAAGGNWDTAGNWKFNLIADGATQNARFTGAGGAVTLDTSRTTKLLRFGGSGSYSIAGAGTLTLDAPDGRAANVEVQSGSHTVAVPVIVDALGANLRVPAGSTLTLSGGVSGVGISKLGDGVATVKNYRVSAVGVQGGTLRIAAHGGNPNDGVSRGELQFAEAEAFLGTLDITNNGVIDPVNDEATIKARIVSGRAGGSWTGTGLTSSTAAANSSVSAVGYATAGDLGLTTFLGQTVAASDVLARYTRLGDANLDGITNIGDFSLLGANFNQSGNWSKGDFNYDGEVNIGDFSLLAANFNQSAPSEAARPGAVPEPAAAALVAATALMSLRRRRM